MTPVPLGMHDVIARLVLGGLPVHDDDDIVSWLHCPDADGDDDMTLYRSVVGVLRRATIRVPAAASHTVANKLALSSARRAEVRESCNSPSSRDPSSSHRQCLLPRPREQPR
jgi:hypothetical protein